MTKITAATVADATKALGTLYAAIAQHGQLAQAVSYTAGLRHARFTTKDSHAAHAIAMLATRQGASVVEDLEPNSHGLYTVSARF